MIDDVSVHRGRLPARPPAGTELRLTGICVLGVLLNVNTVVC